MSSRFSVFLSALAVFGALALGAKTTTLTVTDGGKWSEGVWSDGLPENGDIVIVSNGTGAPASTVNDLVTSLVRIDFTGGEISLQGRALSLTGDETALTDGMATALLASAKIVVEVSLTACESSCWSFSSSAAKNSTFAADVFIAADKTLILKTDSNANALTFEKRIVGPSATLDPRACHGKTIFMGTVDVGYLDCKSQNDYTELEFYSSGNNVRSFTNYGATVRLFKPHAFVTPLLLSHDSVQDNRVQYFFVGDQEFAGIVSPDNVNRAFNIQSYYTGPAFVTLKPTADCSSSIYFGANSASYSQLALVYAPEGNVTQTIFGRGSSRQNLLNGPIRIMNGTLRFTGDTHFVNLQSVSVDGGMLAMATESSATPFYALTTLAIGKNGTFAVEEPCTDTVFTPGTVDLILSPGGKVSVAADKTLSFKSAAFGGKQLQAGSYTSATAEWIAGEGTVVIAEPAANTDYWMDAASGMWSDAAAWLKGAAPAPTDTAYLTAAGANYAVTLPLGVTKPVVAYVRNDGVHATTISPVDGLTLSGWNFQLGWGGLLAVPDNQSLTLTSSPLTLDDGGCVTVGIGSTLTTSGALTMRDGSRFTSAGTLNLNADVMAGAFNSVKQESVVTSVVTLAGGQAKLNNTFRIGYKALMVVSNNTAVANQKNVFGVRLEGGQIFFRDQASFDSGVLWDGSICYPQGFGGTAVFEDETRWTSYLTSGTSRLSLGCQSGFTANLIFQGHAYYDLPGATEFRLTTGNVVLRYDSDATSHMKCGCEMCSQGGDHEIYVTKGLLVYGTSSTSDGSIRIGGVGTTRGDSTGTALYCVDGGAVEIWGSRWAHMFGTSGITVGDGNYSDADVNRAPSVKGTLELRSGTVTNRTGKIYVGIARSLGAIVQTGGEFVSEETSANAKCPVAIGVCNGTGVFTLSNGVFSAKSNVFVGGTPLSEIGISTTSPYKDATRMAMYPRLHDANGELTVAAADLTKPCSFTTEKDLSFGADGNGVLRLGEAGSVTAANVTFWNGKTDVTNHSSKVFCTLGASGAACLTATNAVTVQPGAKLTVDATKFAGDKKVWLVKAVEMKGTFDAMIVGGKGTDSIVQTSKGVVFRRSHGLMILLR